MSNNTTEVPVITSSQFLILGGIDGLVIQTSVIGLVGTAFRAFSKETYNFKTPAIFMTVFNFFCILYSVVIAWSLFVTPDDCTFVSSFSNTASHLMYMSFDAFLLFKSVIFNHGRNRLFIAGMIVLALNRVFWAGLDIAKSGGQWLGGECVYNQYPLTGVAYVASDIACDVYCTIVAIVSNREALFGRSLFKIVRIIIEENVLRSLFMLTVNSILMYQSAFITDPFLVFVCYYCQNLAYTIALNAELVFIQRRKAAAMQQSIQIGKDRKSATDGSKLESTEGTKGNISTVQTN